MDWTDRIGRRVKLRDLHILLAVAKSGSMGKAATELAVSQPVISKAIADLEYALGVRLLDRGPRGVEPTAYGRALLRCGNVVFDDLRSGVREIESLADPTTGELSIGCTEPLASGFVASVIHGLAGAYPKAMFKIAAADPLVLLSRELEERNVELALMPTTGLTLDGDRLDIEVLFDDRHVVLAGATSKWAGRRRIELSDLIGESWVLPPPDSPVGRYIAAAFRASGLQPPDAHVLSFSIPLHQHLVATGSFITTLPLSMLHHAEHLPLKLLPVEFAAHPRPVAIVSLKNRTTSPLAEIFVDRAREIAKTLTEMSA
jgi:DNA-binding transcriptional LysR family regulator